MAGWTLLLLWADRWPLERRGVLPITVVPVIAGLMANDAHAVRAGQVTSLSVAPGASVAARPHWSVQLQRRTGAGRGVRRPRLKSFASVGQADRQRDERRA